VSSWQQLPKKPPMQKQGLKANDDCHRGIV
jgi:hypothetical protein